MTEIKTYGKLQSEKLAEESETAHKIVREIGSFGVNDRQRWLIIYYLALELENIDEMKAMSSFIRDVKGKDLFLSNTYGEE